MLIIRMLWAAVIGYLIAVASSAQSQTYAFGGTYTDSTGSYSLQSSFFANYVDEYKNGVRINTVYLPGSLSFSGRTNGSYEYKFYSTDDLFGGCEAGVCWGGGNGGPVYQGSTKVSVNIVAQLPGKPTGFAASGLSHGWADVDGSYSLIWGQPSGNPNRYELYERIYMGSWARIYNGSSRSRSFSKADEIWEYKVRACNADGCGQFAGPISVQVKTTPGIPSITIPSTDSDGTYAINITSGIGGSVEYRELQVSANGGPYSSHETFSAVDQPDGTYRYRARACNSLSCSSWSTESVIAVYRPPGVPGSIHGPTADVDGIYALSWGPASGEVATYRVYRSPEEESDFWFPWFIVQDSDQLTLSESNVANGSYTYRVEACNVAACSAISESKEVRVLRTPSVPGAISASGLTHEHMSGDVDGSYILAWAPASGIVDSYHLQERVNGGPFSDVPLDSQLSTDLAGRRDGRYSYRVRACNALSCSPWTEVREIQVATLPGTPKIDGPLFDSDGEFTLTWYASGIVYDYYLERKRSDASNWEQMPPISSNYQTQNVFSGIYDYRVKACNLSCSEWSPTKRVGVGRGDGSLRSSSESYKQSIDIRADFQRRLQIGVPIEVPGGINGMQPDLSIAYETTRSQSYDPRQIVTNIPSFIGHGWDLSGVSVISICNTATATYCLDGEQLSSDGAPDFLRPMGAPETLIQRIQENGHSWFKMKSGGLIFSYGKTAQSRSPGFYYLEEIIDEYGNALLVTYERSSSSDLVQPKEINYGSNKVEFDYQSRRENYGTADINVTEGTLRSIRTFSDGALVREYTLHHQYIAGLEFLSAIQMCAYEAASSDSVCAKPILVDWLDTDVDVDSELVWMEGMPEKPSIAVSGITDSLGLFTKVDYADFISFQMNADPALYAWGEYAAELILQDPYQYGSTSTPAYTWSVRALETHVSEAQVMRTEYDYICFGRQVCRHTARLIRLPNGNTVYELFPDNYRLQIRQEYNGNFGGSSILLGMQHVKYGFERKDSCNVSYTCNGHVVYTKYPTLEADYIIGDDGRVLGAVITTDEITDWDSTNGVVANRTKIITAGYGVNGDLASLADVESRVTTVTEYSYNSTVRNIDQWYVGYPSRITTQYWRQGKAGVRQTRQMNTPATVQSVHGHKMAFKNARSEFFAEENGGFVSKKIITTMYDGHGNPVTQTTTAEDVGAFRSMASNSYLNDRFPQHTSRRLSHGVNEDTFYTYNTHLGLVHTTTDANGQVTTKHYDAFGREIKTILPNGTEVETLIEACSFSCPVIGGIPAVRKTTVTTKHPASHGVHGAPQTVTYSDVAGRVLREDRQGFSPTQRILVDTIYDQAGRVDKRSLPYSSGSPQYIDYHYDERGRVWKTTNPDGSYVELDYQQNSDGLEVKRTERIVGAGGDRWFYRWTKSNSLGQLVESIDGYQTEDAVSTTYEYDQMGNNDLVIVNNDPTTAVRSTFGHAGNVTQVIDPSAGTVDYEYDGLGQLRYQTDARGLVTEFAYDHAGRVTQRIDGLGSEHEVTNTFTYDTRKIGLLSTKSSSNGFTENYYYEHPSGIPYLTRTKTDIVVSGTTKSYTTRTSYDNFGRPQTQTYPSGFVAYTAYNSQGYARAVHQDSAYGTILSETLVVDDYGNAEKTALGYGAGRYITDRTYDRVTGQLTSINTDNGQIQDYRYKWWSNGTLYERQTRAATNAIENFAYDHLNRLTESATGNRILSYDYDALGNITQREDSTGGFKLNNYVYDASKPQRLKSVLVGTASQSYSYDAGGNITRINSAKVDADRDIQYGAFGKPVDIKKGQIDSAGKLTNITARETFVYGPDGARFLKTSKNSGGTETTLYLLGGAFEVTFPATGEYQSIEKTYSGNVLHIRKVGIASYTSEFEFIHTDHLGSTDVVTGAGGDVILRDQFDPYGTRRNQSWTGPGAAPPLLDQLLHTSHGFTGHEQLDSVGLIHMNGRVYDPEVARFISPDPIVQAPTYSQSYNRYAYVWNNPLGMIDPTGYTGSHIRGKSGVFCDNCTGPNPPPPPQGDGVAYEEVRKKAENLAKEGKLFGFKDEKGNLTLCLGARSCALVPSTNVGTGQSSSNLNNLPQVTPVFYDANGNPYGQFSTLADALQAGEDASRAAGAASGTNNEYGVATAQFQGTQGYFNSAPVTSGSPHGINWRLVGQYSIVALNHFHPNDLGFSNHDRQAWNTLKKYSSFEGIYMFDGKGNHWYGPRSPGFFGTRTHSCGGASSSSWTCPSVGSGWTR